MTKLNCKMTKNDLDQMDQVYLIFNNAIMRETEEERFFGIFNFSSQRRTAWMQEEGMYIDLFTGENRQMKDVWLPAHGFVWAKRCSREEQVQ